jgi:hypothetical protein
MRVLRLERDPKDERTGVFTSGIVSTGQGRKIALYFTGSQHADENLADVLKQRVENCHRRCRCATPYRAMCRGLLPEPRSSWRTAWRIISTEDLSGVVVEGIGSSCLKCGSLRL